MATRSTSSTAEDIKYEKNRESEAVLLRLRDNRVRRPGVHRGVGGRRGRAGHGRRADISLASGMARLDAVPGNRRHSLLPQPEVRRVVHPELPVGAGLEACFGGKLGGRVVPLRGGQGHAVAVHEVHRLGRHGQLVFHHPQEGAHPSGDPRFAEAPAVLGQAHRRQLRHRPSQARHGIQGVPLCRVPHHRRGKALHRQRRARGEGGPGDHVRGGPRPAHDRELLLPRVRGGVPQRRFRGHVPQPLRGRDRRRAVRRADRRRLCEEVLPRRLVLRGARQGEAPDRCGRHRRRELALPLRHALRIWFRLPRRPPEVLEGGLHPRRMPRPGELLVRARAHEVLHQAGVSADRADQEEPQLPFDRMARILRRARPRDRGAVPILHGGGCCERRNRGTHAHVHRLQAAERPLLSERLRGAGRLLVSPPARASSTAISTRTGR